VPSTHSTSDYHPSDYCAIIWSKNAWAFRSIDEPYFRKLFGMCIPNGMRRKELSLAVTKLGERIRGMVATKVAGANITMAVDGWSNTRHEKMVNVIALTGGKAYYVFVLH